MFPDSVEALDISPTQPQIDHSVVFIDSAVANSQILAAVSSYSQTILLDSAQDGIAQISEALAQQSDLSTVRLIAQGKPGSLQLGNTILSFDNLAEYDDLIRGWSDALTDTADLLLYGYEIGTQESGRALIEGLRQRTGADVAASPDPSNGHLGDNSNFAVVVGDIEASADNGVSMVEQAQEFMAEMPLLALVPHAEATHVAVNNGLWSDSATWASGQVPNDDAKVLIPEELSVTYDISNNARLHTLRVDGHLNFAQAKNTKMLIDTFVVAPDGQLTIGTKDSPIQADKTAQIIFTSDSPIDTQWDPNLLSRGLISHGQARIFGTDKLDFVALQGDVFQGDNELVLNLPEGASTPTGWQVGDRLVLGGTQYSRNGSDENNSRFHDEELTITAINGNRIRFTNNDITAGDNSVLRFDHKRPEGFEELNLYVANTTRNVIFETENGETAPIGQRGHVMFMHNPDVAVNNAGFYNLGRSDKSKLVDDPGKNVDGSEGLGTNRRGRYSLHFHRTGVDDINSAPSRAIGNAVVGSPGWGIVHHNSHAVLENNVVFDVVGSGIVAESGNEIGAWRNNLTIKTTGDDEQRLVPDQPNRAARFDLGFEGEGYWVQGAAQVAMEDNIAISAKGGGINIFNGTDLGGFNNVREADTFAVDNLPPDLQWIVQGQKDTDVVDVTNVPLRQLSGFESYNSLAGIIFWNHMRNDDGRLEFSDPGLDGAHSARSLVEDFKLWNIASNNLGGIHTQYSTQIDFVDGLIVGNPDSPRGRGITTNPPSQDLLFKNLNIEGFGQGIEVPREGGPLVLDTPYAPVPSRASRLENSYLANNQLNLSNERSARSLSGEFMYPDYFEIVNTTFDTAATNTAPTANFVTTAAGGLAVAFDASPSFDSDSPDSSELSNYGITSYGWDFDNDGTIDRFGRQVSHIFGTAATYQVTLTVWDNQGESATSTQTITVEPSDYPNLIINGDLSNSNLPAFHSMNSRYAEQGWVSNEFKRQAYWTHDGEAAVLTGATPRAGMAIGQVLLDNGIRRGEQTFSLDIKNTEGNARDNKINVQVWGIDGEFNNQGWSLKNGPQQVGALPMSRTKLLDENVGGSTFDWKTFNWNLDFADGYQFVFVKITGNMIATQEGDFVAIDNVMLQRDSLSSEGETEQPNAEEDAPNLDDQLVMHLDFEDSGTVAQDSSPQGNSNQGELRNGATFESEAGFGGIVNLDGNDDFIHVNDSNDINLEPHHQRTVSLWFKTENPFFSDRKQVLYEEGGTTRGLNIYLDRGKLYVGGWNRPASESNWAGTYLSTDAIAANTWHHVALVLDATPGEKDVQAGAFTAYLDGVAIGTGEGSQLWNHGDDTGLGGLNQGTRFHDGIAKGTGTHSLLGTLDNVRIYNQALTARAVSFLAQSA